MLPEKQQDIPHFTDRFEKRWPTHIQKITQKDTQKRYHVFCDLMKTTLQ
jgi:hypothetical protein